MSIDTISVAAYAAAFSNITIYNADYSEVLYSRAFGLGRNATLAVGVSSNSAVHVQWGQDANNIGVSALGLSMSSTGLAVPEPAALLMLIPGVLLLARRKRASA